MCIHSNWFHAHILYSVSWRSLCELVYLFFSSSSSSSYCFQFLCSIIYWINCIHPMVTSFAWRFIIYHLSSTIYQPVAIDSIFFYYYYFFLGIDIKPILLHFNRHIFNYYYCCFVTCDLWFIDFNRIQFHFNSWELLYLVFGISCPRSVPFHHMPLMHAKHCKSIYVIAICFNAIFEIEIFFLLLFQRYQCQVHYGLWQYNTCLER